MKKLNVLFLNSWYPNEVLPFNGNFIQQHARSVSLYCNVVCLNVQGRNQEKLFEVTTFLNKGVYEIIVYFKMIESTTFFSLLKKKRISHNAYRLGLKEVYKELEKIDLVHLNVILPAGLFALYLVKKFKIPFIITEHSTIYLKSNPINHSFLEKYFIKKIIKKSSMICPVSNDLKNAMISKGLKGNYCVVPNVVDTSIFKFKSKKKNRLNRIIHVSTLKDEHKNFSGIINVMKKLSGIRQDFHFTIISDGEIDVLKKYINKVGLSKQFITIIGKSTSEKIANTMQDHDLFILFSNYENLPCVISEALVSGLPVISSNVGGINEMITSDNGVLVQSKNEEQLLHMLNYILNNLLIYDSEKISKKAIDTYSYEIVGKKYLEIYHQILT